MKKLLVIFIVSIIIVFSLSACADVNLTPVQEVQTNRFVQLDGFFILENAYGGTICVVEDTITGILYLRYSGIHQGGLTPWLKADGTPYKIDDIK